MEIAAPDCRGGNRGRRKSMESEGFKNVFLTILTENRKVAYGLSIGTDLGDLE